MFMGEPAAAEPVRERPSISTTQSSSDEGGRVAAEGGGGGDDQAITRTVPSIKLPEISSITLVQPSEKRKHRSAKAFRVLRAMLRSFPIMTPTACKLSSLPGGKLVSLDSNKTGTGVSGSGTKVTGTLFGYKKGKVSLSLQQTPNCLPSLVLELGIHTSTLQKELGSGMVRIALECEKKPQPAPPTGEKPQKTRLLDEAVWTMYCNGKRTGFGMRREASEEDLSVMELLKPVSQGAGVFSLEGTNNKDDDGITTSSSDDPEDCELAYMRAHFEHVVGSKDSETLYMLNPDGNSGPELTIFFVRI